MKLRLIYPPGSVQRPILSEAIRKFQVPINILEASVNARKGEIVISVEAEKKLVNSLIRFLRREGVTVERLLRILEVDDERCIDCGHCVSLCPVVAISLQPDWSVEFDEEKCVGCRVCVDACPVRAVLVY
ncbi:MAG: 4Fe-4S dicluster domain-containing protein [Nitrososphaeria archaeon]|nr:4Fe-4S dicluster domain-containing protein [Nitrososphaeria archaeon]NIN52971.1 4Fe-4S dicluster domain-containing protein [Nitrososphaeria archaeon]NIQ33530.1 4Fe-4S dicluster domain-containing protein [Nitrososphaeria archaeon]